MNFELISYKIISNTKIIKMLDELGLLIFACCILIYLSAILFSFKKKKRSKLKFLGEIYRNWVNNRKSASRANFTLDIKPPTSSSGQHFCNCQAKPQAFMRTG